jgi:hypothetical protein
MSKTATKKVTKKVSTAKGKGKPAKAKVVKKTATKKAAVKKVTKKAVAKKPAVKKTKVVTDPYAFKAPSKTNPYPYFRYGNVSISDVSNEKYPELVMITAGPAKYEDLMGRKYLNKEFAMKAINAEQAETLIGKGAKSVVKELISIGIMSGSDTVEYVSTSPTGDLEVSE